MKIKQKIFLIFFISSISLVAVAVGVFYYFSSNDLRSSIEDHLETTAQLRSVQVKQYLRKITDRAVDFSSDGLIKNSLKDLIDKKINIDDLHTILDKHLIRNKLPIDNDIYEIYILDKKSKIIGTSNPEEMHKNIFALEGYSLDVNRPHVEGVVFDEEFDVPVLVVYAPVFLDGENIGSIINKINPNELFNILTDRSGLRSTWESYLVNEDYTMISPSRFLDDVVLKQGVETENAVSCFKDTANGMIVEGSSLGAFHDYRGIDVVGSHRYIDSVRWCLLAEIDEDDAVSPITQLLYIDLLSIGFAVFIASVILSILIGKIISKPIEKLHDGANIIESGNLNYKVGSESKDEIGDLSRSFDNMLSSINDSRDNLNKKVDFQTKNVTKQKEKLEAQQMAILNILEDIQDERSKAEFEEKKVSSILHNIGDGVFVVDDNRNIIVFNSQAEKISGYKRDEVIGKKYNTVLKFVDEKNPTKINSKFVEDVMETGENQEMPPNTVLIQKDGGKVPVADSAAPLKDGQNNVIGCIVVFRDTTAERAIDKAKSEFISVASHQLRTPMTGIQWVIERFLKKETKLSKQGKEYLSDLHKSSIRLSELVDSLLNVSRIESGGGILVDLEKLDLIALVSDYIEELTPLLDMKNITLNFKEHPDKFEITSDSKVIRNIIQSIISNAIEYTPKDGTIDISVEKNSDVMIKIKDTGIGIPKEAQLGMFEKFHRAENAKSVKTDGSGLGLYIAKKATEALGGKIGFISHKDKGTTFYVELPIESKAKDDGKKLL